MSISVTNRSGPILISDFFLGRFGNLPKRLTRISNKYFFFSPEALDGLHMVWTVQGKIEPGASKFSFAIAVPPFNTKGGFQVPGFVLGDVGGSVK